jgi:serine/threonine protein kinase
MFNRISSSLQHPYILPILKIDYRPDKKELILFREFVPNGSLRDNIYRGVWKQTNPKDTFTKKYNRVGKPLAPNLYLKYGRQILEVCYFIFHFHFHFHHNGKGKEKREREILFESIQCFQKQ